MDTEADWAETKTILQEVEKLFQTDDDIKDVVEIQKLKKEIGMCIICSRYHLLCTVAFLY